MFYVYIIGLNTIKCCIGLDIIILFNIITILIQEFWIIMDLSYTILLQEIYSRFILSATCTHAANSISSSYKFL